MAVRTARLSWVHKATVAQDHVAVAIAITSSTKLIGIPLHEKVSEFMGIGEVGIGMPTAKIFQGSHIADAASRCA